MPKVDERAERALEVAKRIAAKEAELEALRREFASYLNGGEKLARAPLSGDEGPLPTAPERVLEVIKRDALENFSPADLTRRLPDIDVKLLRNTCVRLARQGRLMKLKRGLYSLPRREVEPN